MSNSIYIFVDGATKGNNVKGNKNTDNGVGVILKYGKHMKSVRVHHAGYTNNQCEIMSAIYGLRSLNGHAKSKEIVVIPDSKYVVETMKGNYKKKKNLDFWRELDGIAAEFDKLSFQWVPRDKNFGADELANIALEEPITEFEFKYKEKAI